MNHFTKEQLQEIATFFNMIMPAEKPEKDSLPVKDGHVQPGQPIWWRAESGPEHVLSNKGHWTNIEKYPHLYSHAKPAVKTVYVD